MNNKGEGPKRASAHAVWGNHRDSDKDSGGCDFPDRDIDNISSQWSAPGRAWADPTPAAPPRTLLDGLMQGVRVLGAILLLAACVLGPGDGSDTSSVPGWYWVALGALGATGGSLLTLGIVYQRHRSPVLDRPAWDAEGRRRPVRCFTRVQVEPGHFEVRDETNVVAGYRSTRKPRFRGLRIAGRSYRLRRSSFGMRMFADGESNPVLRVARQGTVTLDNGAIFIPARRVAPSSRSWVALKQYRMQRFNNSTGTEVMVLRLRESPDGDRIPDAEARIYAPVDVSEVLPMVCYSFAHF